MCFCTPGKGHAINGRNDPTPRILTLFYIQDHSTHGTGITNENELSESCWTKICYDTMFDLNTGDVINFGYSHCEGLIAEIDILSNYANDHEPSSETSSSSEENEKVTSVQQKNELHEKSENRSDKTLVFRPTEDNKDNKFRERRITLLNEGSIKVQKFDKNNHAFEAKKISDTSLIFKSDYVSRNHATISLKNKSFYIQDHSLNGTSITYEDGSVTKLDGKLMKIKNGTIINFGDCAKGIIVEVEVLSEYEEKRLLNIKEKNEKIPLKDTLPKKGSAKKKKFNLFKLDKGMAKYELSDEEDIDSELEIVTRSKKAKKDELIAEAECPFKCQKCEERFESENEIEIHKIEFHPEVEAVQSFSSGSNTLNGLIHCFQCGDEFLNEDDVTNHIKALHPELAQPLTNDNGSKIFDNSDSDSALSYSDDEFSSEDDISKKLPNDIEPFQHSTSSSEDDEEVISVGKKKKNSSIPTNDVIIDEEKLASQRRPTIHTFLANICTLIKEDEDWDNIVGQCKSHTFEEWNWKQYKRPFSYNRKTMAIDVRAATLYKASGDIDFMPVVSSAGEESDSLYSAASMLLCGKPYLNLELRASSLISFAKNKPDITDAAKAKGHFEFDYLEEMLNVASLDSSQSIINLIALTWGIEVATLLHYPHVGNGLSNMNVVCNQGFIGASSFDFHGHRLMWSGEENPDGFIPTQFVPLLSADERDLANMGTEIENEEVVIKSKEIPADTKIRYGNFGTSIGMNNMYSLLESVREEDLPTEVPNGIKSNTTFYIKRKNFQHGPGSVIDDKAPYTGGYGSHVYALQVCGDRFEKVHNMRIQTKEKFTFNEKGTVKECDPNWIISWESYCKRVREDSELKRSVTVYVTKHPDFLWLNDICVVQYIGIDNDRESNDRPHGNAIRKEAPHRRVERSLITEALKFRDVGAPSWKIYDQLTDTSTITGLTGTKQIYNAVSYKKQRELGKTYGPSASQ
jgi:pSer/pThr/pTyr-binding forkhead associated (FHA) protein